MTIFNEFLNEEYYEYLAKQSESDKSSSDESLSDKSPSDELSSDELPSKVFNKINFM